MGKTLAEYAAENPMAMPEPEQEQLRIAGEQQAKREKDRQEIDDYITRLEQSKARIMDMIECGTAPHWVLMRTLSLIGLLTNDNEWSNKGQEIIYSIYGETDQQSLLDDTAREQLQKISEQKQAYKDKMIKQLDRQVAATRKITASLTEAINALEEIE